MAQRVQAQHDRQRPAFPRARVRARARERANGARANGQPVALMFDGAGPMGRPPRSLAAGARCSRVENRKEHPICIAGSGGNFPVL